MMNEIQVVPRDAIPPIEPVERQAGLQELGELRDFRWNSLLREFMPSAPGFAVSWVRLKYGEVLVPQVHAIPSLMVFYAGGGTMLGELEGPVVKDDVVMVPAGCKHGFVGGPEGLHAVSIQLGEGHDAEARAPVAGAEDELTGLFAHNQRRLQEFKRRPVFDLLHDGTLHEPVKRRVFLDGWRSWFEGTQALLVSRQACCVDPRYATAFRRELDQERSSSAPRASHGERANASHAHARDVTLEAVIGWFTYQMFLLDNAEKAAVELAIRSANAAYHSASGPALAQYSTQRYLSAQLEHAATDKELLRGQSARSYARLRSILDEAWDMLSAMSDRVVELTRQA